MGNRLPTAAAGAGQAQIREHEAEQQAGKDAQDNKDQFLDADALARAFAVLHKEVERREPNHAKTAAEQDMDYDRPGRQYRAAYCYRSYPGHVL